ncbi:hypothetical protein HA402_000268 [Bradysia odoriphaga]|nr:hypothetical protein HA402_000268 [Bradysia odoriphaga]
MRETHQLRDIQSWMDSGIKLSTPSNEAAKLFDASISQLSGWYDDKQLGGLEATMTKMLDADPQFIGGRSMIYAFEAVGGANVNNNPELKTNVEQLIADVAANSNCDKWEKLHVKALEHLSSSSIDAAIRQWEEILIEYPSDILSLHLTGLTCLMTGRLDRIGDISGRVIPSFKDEFSLGTAHAWHSFGLSEINLTTQAEWHARKALTLDPKNGWSTHALAHVFEMTSRLRRRNSVHEPGRIAVELFESYFRSQLLALGIVLPHQR